MKTAQMTLIIALFLSNNVLANNSNKELFKVLASYGDAKVQKNNQQIWENISIGNKLNDKDKLKLSITSYVGLIHTSGKTLEIKKEGIYNIGELIKEVSPSSVGISNKFADFVVDAVCKVDDPSNLSDYKGQMTVTGSVERKTFENSIKVYMPKVSNLIDPNVTFTWYNSNNPSKYNFVILNNFAKPVLTKNEIKDTSVAVDLSKLDLKRGECFYWGVFKSFAPDVKSQEYCLTLLSEKTAKAITDSLELMKKEMGGELSAINKLIIASFYEQHNLFYNANSTYQEIISMEPAADDYKKVYALFLIRQGLITEASKVWTK